MDPHLTNSRLFVIVVLYLFMIALACGSGYWMARLLPVRFNGEKVLIGLLIGSLAALATYGVEKLTQSQVQLFQIISPLGWFLLQGIAGEVTAQTTSRRRRAKP